MIRVLYYRSKCIGCNACVEAAPNYWRVSMKDGKCSLIGSKAKKGIYSLLANKEDLEALRSSATNCPVNIIKLVQLNK